MLKAAIKRSSGEDQVRHRIVPAETIQHWVEKLDNLKSEIGEIMVEEKEEKHVGSSSSPHFRLLGFSC
jgi:ATP-dependent RNA helicase DDX27